jgi:hypothetical protein
VSFVTTSVEAHFRLIEKRHGIHLLREVIAGFEPVEAAAVHDLQRALAQRDNPPK